MGVQHYEWGKVAGGSSGSGTTTAPAEALYGEGQEFQGALPIGDTIITFTAPTKSVQVINQDDNNGFEVSFDGGATWVSLNTYGQVRENVTVTSIILRSIAAGVSYYVIGVLTA